MGLLHQEMRRLGSLIMAQADAHRVPAGSALAVDRDGYSDGVTQALANHPNVTLVRERVDALPDGPAILATGPLTAASLAQEIGGATGAEALAFFDALAPIVHFDTIDMDIAWKASRWDKGEADYINCPMDKEQYLAFHAALLAGEKTEFKEWEKDTPYFDGCMPIEVMAERGIDTLRYGPMKPVGLDNPRTGRWPYAVVQLRQDNRQGTLWNIVGFQTKLKHAEQVRLFRTIPGLQNAEFARLGGLHRNTFIRSPELLDETLRLKNRPNLRFAGRSRGARAISRARRSACSPGASPRPNCGARRSAPRGDDRARRAAGAYHRRCGGGDVSADERQFRADAADPRPHEEGGSQADVHRPRARRVRTVAQLSSDGACCGGGHFARDGAFRLTAVVANSAAVIAPEASLSAVANLVVALIAHSSKLSRPSPLVSSLAKALRRAARYSSRVMRPSRSLS